MPDSPIVCPSCDQINSPEAKFCNKCAMPLAVTKIEVQEGGDRQKGGYEIFRQKIQELAVRERKLKKIKTLTVGYAFVLALSVIGCFALSGKDAAITSKTESNRSAASEISNSLGMKFIYISPGTFMMGSPPSEPGRDDDETQHRVTLTKGYYLQTTEVTQGQWKAVMGSNPSHFKNCGDNCPVESVSWNDVQEFIRKLNQREGANLYRLPTEAEWEYAARAGSTTSFAFGRCLSTDQANYDGNYPLSGCPKGQYREATLPVGSFSPNAWGLYDMHGNVWEWCQDGFGDYPSSAVTDPAGSASGDNRLLRGGGWNCAAGLCRSAARFFHDSYAVDYNYGFRLARLPEQQ
jgi:formylglycine-generating enzyme